jgi:hypothetical protein
MAAKLAPIALFRAWPGILDAPGWPTRDSCIGKWTDCSKDVILGLSRDRNRRNGQMSTKMVVRAAV